MIFVGLPGAGKSSFYRARFMGTYALISKDLMSTNRRSKSVRQAESAAAILRAGGNVVVDNTNINRAERALLISVARACGARVTGYYFDVSRADCRARNATRQGKARVPDFVIGMMGNNLERPTYAEGFDALLRVTLLPNGALVARHWKAESEEE